jgi:hypothetical protein
MKQETKTNMTETCTPVNLICAVRLCLVSQYTLGKCSSDGVHGHLTVNDNVLWIATCGRSEENSHVQVQLISIGSNGG